MILEVSETREILIPAELVAAEPHARLTAERRGDALVLRRPARHVRAGWAAAARKIAEHDDDIPAMGEFGNRDDAELGW